MTATSRIHRPLRALVYVRRGASGGLPVDGASGGGGASGGELEPNLRCDEVRLSKGSSGGYARLTWVDEPPVVTPFDEVLKRFTSDDHVRVEVFPLDDEGIGGSGDARVVFDGVLVRHAIESQADGASTAERVTFVAKPFGWFDDTATEHLIRGRWVADDLATDAESSGDGETQHFVVESPRVPAVFNFRGRPNCHRSANVLAASAGGLTGPLFTHDDDPEGLYWTVGEALASILARWLYGPAGSPLPRHVAVEDETLTQLSSTRPDGGRPDRFVGLDAQVPEVNVQGLGVFEAFERVCDAGGFEFALEPAAFHSADREYQLRLWRRGTGQEVHLDLDNPGSTYATGEAALRRNNTSKINLVRDGAEIINEVFAVAPAYVETNLVLWPMWNPDDVDDAEVNDELQQATEELLTGDGYHAKYVAGGVLFERLSHVGRAWGRDCLGGFEGYPEEDIYQQPPDGEDFVELLGLNSTTLAEQRAAVGITDPIRWTRRVRQALPLRNEQARAEGTNYLLEVSEDGGSTWQPCVARFETLTGNLGIFLNIPNLAAVNNATLGTGAVPPVAESWWQLIADRMLLFSLTCTIEADHALRFDALHRTTSGSRYRRGQMVVLPHDQVWQDVASPFNTEPDWAALGATVDAVRGAAEGRRDGTQDSRVHGTAGTWVMDIDRYRLGDRVKAIRGRNHTLSASTGEGVSYPNVVGITLQLSPKDQAVRLALHDNRLTGGFA